MNRLSELSSSQRQLVQLITSLRFGRISGVAVRDGNIRLGGLTLTRSVKLDQPAKETTRTEDSADFTLQASFIALFEHIGRIGSGVIERIDVRHSTPVLMEWREPWLANNAQLAPKGKRL